MPNRPLPPPVARELELVARALSHSPAAALVVAPDGAIFAASAEAGRLLGSGLRGRASRAVFGLGWRELALVAGEADSDVVVTLSPRDVRTPRAGWRLRPELLHSERGDEIGVVAYLMAPAEEDAGGSSFSRRSRNAVTFDDLFGEDMAVVATKAAAARFAATRLPILLLAETGTGKDLLARAIHAASGRRDRPFVAINCGALSPHLLESELFGYAPGAFTDARREGHEGKIGAARGGTLFLDEVAEMPGPLQALLLRVLEDGTYFRVGESSPRQSDVRLICATCRDLAGMVDDGSFRRDLYFRIAGAILTLPPVRERSDVAHLARHVLERLVAREFPGRRTPRLSRAAIARLVRGRWPGNVRQIRTALQYALALADGDEIRPEHLPRIDFGEPEERPGSTPAGVAATRSPASGNGRLGLPTSGRLEAVERAIIERTVEEAGGNLSLAARRLGVARSTLYRRLRTPPSAPRTRR
ncbi:MAG: sigma 54-interacting transcriptional regulator [Thermoanaerobaculia bacterium]